MKQKHSLELRLAVVKHYLAGNNGQEETARLFGVDRASVRLWDKATAKSSMLLLSKRDWSKVA
ncbi:helix-turn-helix domain-containing protein [Photorhabdus akhurstii]|uniref:helix-turn-helix domain-containing protein n=1 Tax=Photorhabdus akhurstii TaxID=171438 RepID=UPI000D4410D1|nr:hypothetical protein C6H69_07500 [Photorhabdus luminescens]